MSSSPSEAPPAGSFATGYLLYLLARASHVVSAEFHAVLKAWDLSVPEWRVLACLSQADGLTVGELAAMSIMQQPRMTKLLDRMAAQGLVGRHVDQQDRRRVAIYLTDLGRQRAAPVLVAAKRHEAAVLAPFTAAERTMIKQALDLLINGSPASRPAAPRRAAPR